MLLCKTMKRHGVLYYHLTFQSTLSSLTIKMTSLTAELRWIVQCGPGISMWISFYCTSLRTVWLTWSQILDPVPVVRSRSKFLFAPDQHLDRDKGGGFLVTLPLFLVCLHVTGKCPSLSQWGWWSVWTSGSFISRPQRPVCQFTITRRNSVSSPLTKLPSHFIGFPRLYVLGNFYQTTSIAAS